MMGVSGSSSGGTTGMSQSMMGTGMGINAANPGAVIDALLSQAVDGTVTMVDVQTMIGASGQLSYAETALANSPLDPVTDPTQFVTLMYENMLGRAPTATDLSYWTNFLNGNGDDRAAAMVYMANSAEAASHTQAMGWMSGWTTGMAAVTGIAAANQVQATEMVMAHGLNGTVTTAALETIGSSASPAAFAQTMLANSPLASVTDPTQFVTLMYENMLGRAPDAAGQAYYVNALNADGGNRAAIMMYIASSPEALSHAQTTGWLSATSGGSGTGTGVSLTSSAMVQEALMIHAVNGSIGPADMPMMTAAANASLYGETALAASPLAVVTDPATFVTDMYHNMLGRSPTAADLTFWVNAIDNAGGDRAVALVAMANAPEALAHAHAAGWL